MRESGAVIVKSIYGAGFGSNCYVALDDSMSNAVVIDPSVPYERAVASLGFVPSFRAILLTHGHADHLLALDNWRNATGSPVMIGSGDAYALLHPEANCSRFLGLGDLTFGEPDVRLSDGDEIAVGDQTLRVLFTPGHSCGSICFYCDGHLLSGDTLFADGGVGRSDLFGGDEGTLRASLSALMELPSSTVVYPGHGPQTTIASESCFHSYFI